jgi:DNA-directed RNA polymerase specialized sigma24 family protein
MRRGATQRAEALLVRSFAFEPALRARLRRDGTDAARIDEIVHEVYARLLIAAEAGRIRARHLRTILFALLADVLAPAGQQLVVGEHVEKPPPSRGSLWRSASESFRQAVRARIAARNADRDELRRLIAVAARFPAPQRQVFTLRKVYGLHAGAIAQALNLSEAEVERCLIAATLACARECFDPDRPDPDGSAPDS